MSAKQFKEIVGSNRFWSLVGIAISYALWQYGFIDEVLFTMISTILGGHVAVRTVDRLGEKAGGDEK